MIYCVGVLKRTVTYRSPQNLENYIEKTRNYAKRKIRFFDKVIQLSLEPGKPKGLLDRILI